MNLVLTKLHSTCLMLAIVVPNPAQTPAFHHFIYLFFQVGRKEYWL